MIDWTKPIETTDGQPCTYLGEFDDGYHWVAYRSHTRKVWGTIKAEPNGFAPHIPCDIRNAPERRRLEGWCNVWEDGMCLYGTRADADLLTTGHETRIACVRIDQPYVVGEGLE